MEEKKNSSILIILLVLILLAGVFFWMGGGEEKQAEMPQTEEDMIVENDATKESMSDEMGDDVAESQVAGNMVKAGSYEEYSSDKLMTAESRTVLFFKATWCPSCRALDKALEEDAAEIPEGITILEVDYDSAEDLRKKYGVTTQHTLVQVDENGDLVHKWSGSPSLSSVLKEIK